MKHKRIFDVLPYTYLVTEKLTGLKYYGVRYANIKLHYTPSEDLGLHYFSSSKSLKYNFKEHPENFEYKIHYTFDTVEEALDYESRFLTHVYKKADWLNKTNNRAFEESKISRDYDKVALALKASETMKNDIVDGKDGHQRRIEKTMATRRRLGKDKESGAKANKTKSKIGEDGLTTFQRAYRKGFGSKSPDEKSAIAKKGSNSFAKKLANMSDNEFEEFLLNYSEQCKKSYTTIRNKQISK